MARVLALFAAAAAALPEPGAAQTIEDAARANAALAVRLCVAAGARAAAAIPSFTAAGFAYSTRGTPGVETWHIFTAPASTVRVELYEGQMAPACGIMVNHLPPSAAGPLIGAVLTRSFPGRFTPSGPGPDSCATYTDSGQAIGFVVSVGAADYSAGCPALGSTSINIFSAV